MIKQKTESHTDLSFKLLLSRSKRWFLRLFSSNKRKVTTNLIHDIPHDGVNFYNDVKISTGICQGADIRHVWETQQVLKLSLCENHFESQISHYCFHLILHGKFMSTESSPISSRHNNTSPVLAVQFLNPIDFENATKTTRLPYI